MRGAACWASRLGEGVPACGEGDVERVLVLFWGKRKRVVGDRGGRYVHVLEDKYRSASKRG